MIKNAIINSIIFIIEEIGNIVSVGDNERNLDTAKVILYVRSTSSGYRVISGYGISKFEIKYKLVIKSPEDKELYVYSDE